MSSPGTRTSTGGGNKEGAKRWEGGGHTWMAGSGRRRGRPARSGAEGGREAKSKMCFLRALVTSTILGYLELKMRPFPSLVHE
jgi:hypothetical protein